MIRTALLTFILCWSWTDGLHGQPFDVSAAVTLSTDYLLRGLSQTDGGGALQAEWVVSHESGLFGGLWASNVEFAFEEFLGERQPREIEIDGYLGYEWHWTESFSLLGSARYYYYPGSSVDYDYLEFALETRIHWFVASVTWIDDFDSAPALATEASVGLPVGLGVTASAGAGWLDADGPFIEDYPYWSVTLSRAIGRYELVVGYFGTDSDSRVRLGDDVAGSRWVAHLTAFFGR